MANIQSNLNKIKNAVLGIDVRDSIHDGIKAINEEVENTTDRQVQLEGTFDELVINAGNSNAELLDIRIDKNGTVHESAGSSTRTVILEDNIVTPDSITDEYINILQSTKLYINKYQTGYYPDSGLINRVELTGHVCTDPIPIDKLYDEITVPLDDDLKGQSFIFLDSNKQAYYSKNVNGIKTNIDMQNYLFYNENTKEYKLLIKKYFQEVGRVAYVSFNFLSGRKYIKKLASNKVLKWLTVESDNLSDNSVSPNHIKNSDILCDYIDIYNKYISTYTSSKISYIDSNTQVATTCLNINDLSDTLSFKVTSDLKGQVIVLKNNLDEYFVSLNANLIINKDFRQLNGYMTYDTTTQFATIDIKKLRENVGITTITGLAVSSDSTENIRGFIYKELKWLSVGAKHIKDNDILCNYIDIYNKYISTYTSSEISYIDSNTQVATTCLNINDLSDTLSFKVTSDLKGQVIVLKNNLDEYFVSLNANLIINKDFRQLNGYMTYDTTTQFATIDIKKLRENVGITTITGLAVSSDSTENIRGFIYKELRWLKIPKNEYEEKNKYKEEKIEIRLLDEYVLLKDVEYNFYTCQTVMCSRKLPDKYMVIWQYDGSGGTRYDDSIKILETSTGVHYLTVKVFKEEEGELILVDSKTTKISIVENTVVNKNILFIGDSRIEDGASPWPARVQLVTTVKNTLDASNTFLGSRGGGSLANHEGRSGWRSYDYCMTEIDTKRNCTNEFYNASFTDTLDGLTSHFDFSYYMQNKGYSSVDLVGIYLGANDLYDDNSIIYQKMMIKSIKNYNANIKIILFSDYLSPCDNYSLLPAGLHYITRRTSQINYYAKQKQMINDLGYSDIFIVGANNVIDDWYDFNRSSRKISYRNSDNETKEYIIDAIHPKVSGYDKIADLVSAHINYIFS